MSQTRTSFRFFAAKQPLFFRYSAPTEKQCHLLKAETINFPSLRDRKAVVAIRFFVYFAA